MLDDFCDLPLEAGYMRQPTVPQFGPPFEQQFGPPFGQQLGPPFGPPFEVHLLSMRAFCTSICNIGTSQGRHQVRRLRLYRSKHKPRE